MEIVDKAAIACLHFEVITQPGDVFVCTEASFYLASVHVLIHVIVLKQCIIWNLLYRFHYPSYQDGERCARSCCHCIIYIKSLESVGTSNKSL